MYIMTSDSKTIVDSGFVERFCLVEKPDATLIVAGYSADRAVTIGRYADRQEADCAKGRQLILGEEGRNDAERAALHKRRAADWDYRSFRCAAAARVARGKSSNRRRHPK